MRALTILAVAAVCAAPALRAQPYEFTVLGGGNLTLNTTIENPAGNADAGFKKGWSAGVAFGQNMYEHVGGEIRYTYQRHEMKLESGSARAQFGAESHAVHYDILIHSTGRESAVRPYVAIGGGVRQFRGTGEEVVFQPLSDIAVLTKTSQAKPMLSVGAGVKFSIGGSMKLRLDVHDYITSLPKDVIALAPNSSASGWLNNIVPTIGISWTF